jgi:predicted secreted protein
MNCRKLLTLCSLVAVGVFGLAACGSSSSKDASGSSTTTAAAAKADVVVTQADAGKSQTLTVGQTMDVEVSAPTGTNYSWSVSSGYSTAVVKQTGEPQRAATKPGMPGAPAITTFRFTAVGAGSTTIAIENKDNSSGAVGQTVSVPVTVTK